jgi:hypothetical protein
VVGAFSSPPSRSANASGAFDPEAEGLGPLTAWLRDGRGDVVFVGFGSMVIADVEAISALLIEAAQLANVRVLVQSNWSKLTTARASGGSCFDVGPCPHDWLLPQVDAVVHHGGAGTTAAGLRAGKPTLVCPFFADQHFWGEMVKRAGVGPAPCPIGKLTAESLAARLRVLTDGATKAAAQRLAAQMATEDGVAGALAYFESKLPRHELLCDASLLLDPPQRRVARFRSSDWRGRGALKLGSEAAAIMRNRVLVASASTRIEAARLSTRWLRPHRANRWGISRLPGVLSGLVAGLVGVSWQVLLFHFDPITVPDKYARRCGALGCVFGLLLAPFWMIGRLAHAALLLFDRIGTGA